MGEASVTVPTDETLLVVDGHSLAFRAFFALPVDNFSTSSGQATNAVWGFATMLAQVIDAEKPDHLGVAFDVKGGTFRNEMLPQYKGTREAAPEELLTQLPLIQRMLTALGVTYIEKPSPPWETRPATTHWYCPETETPSSWWMTTSPCCTRVITSKT